ncbi:MAG: hypothetical protein JW915_13885 [Chitinispirillaceae bacterium]|nr:hypothetical protein [Chitinispirillaceae bacterium]
MKIGLLIEINIIVLTIFSLSNSFTGQGKGTLQDPYKISNIGQLQEMDSDLDGFYTLICDIEASVTAKWNDGKGFNPIGDGITPFTGLLDGKGFCIRGLHIDRKNDKELNSLDRYVEEYGQTYHTDGEGDVVPSYTREQHAKGYEYHGMLYLKQLDSDNIGLISRNEGTIKNVKLEQADIKGDFLVGGITGENRGDIEHASYNGTINAKGLIGGIAGDNRGRIVECISTIALSGADYAGGIAGRNKKNIIRSTAQGEIFDTDTVHQMWKGHNGNGCGGCVGENHGSVVGCLVKVHVYNGGGFVGRNFAQISGCGVDGSPLKENGEYLVTNFAGNIYSDWNKAGNSMFACYVIHKGEPYTIVRPSKKTKTQLINNGWGFAHYEHSIGMGIVEHCYFASAITIFDKNAKLALYRNQFCKEEIYEDITYKPDRAVVENQGKISSCLDAGLDFETMWNIDSAGNYGYPYLRDSRFSGTGSGTQDDPYRITTVQQLQEINRDPTACYVLFNDIDASVTRTERWNSNGGFTPIMNFTGSFDGKGYRIFNLYINRPHFSHVGLFGYIKGATIKNAGLVNMVAYGNNYCALVAGENNGGTIECVYAAGRTHGAGMVDNNHGTVRNSFALVDDYCAGLIKQRGTLPKNCYFIGKIQNQGDTVGLSGLTCEQFNTLAENVFLCSTIKKEKTGKKIQIQKNRVLYEKNVWKQAGMDFDSVWNLDKNVNNGLPFLKTVQFADALESMNVFECKEVRKFTGKGSGTRSDPWQITTVEQLQQMALATDASYILASDIDASVTKLWNSGDGFKPAGSIDRPFCGTFNGNGYVINGLYVHTSKSPAGLFAVIGKNGRIIDLKMREVEISGEGETGGAAGINTGIISGCCINGSVTGSGNCTGGVIGQNEGLIAKSEASVTITGKKCVGGISGFNKSGKIIRCSFTGKVSGESKCGGITGDNLSGVIREAFTRGIVQGNEYIGGLAGWNRFSTIIQTYSTAEVVCKGHCGSIDGKNQESPVHASFINTTRIDSNTAGQHAIASGNQMKTVAPYSEKGWDFQYVWQWDVQKNDGFPFLGKDRYGKIITLSEFPGCDSSLIAKVHASSCGNTKYRASNIIDGKFTTAWVEGSSGSGVGEWIEVAFREAVSFERIVIVNGFAKTPELYTANNRVCALSIKSEGDYGIREGTVFLEDLHFSSESKIPALEIAGLDGCKKIRFTIEYVYNGEKYDDTCISEIMFNNLQKKD